MMLTRRSGLSAALAALAAPAVMTNYPGKQADAATNAMMEKLYRRYAGT